MALQSELAEKIKLRNEYARSIANPGWFAKATLTAFRKERKRLNDIIRDIKFLIKKHPDTLKANDKK